MLAKSRWSQLLKCLYKQPWVFAFLPCLVAFLVQTNTLAALSLWSSWLLPSTTSLIFPHHQVQTTTLAKEMLDPTQTVVNTRRLNLSHFDVFPVAFKLCIQPGFNQTAVVEAGYSEVGWMESKTNVNISHLNPWIGKKHCQRHYGPRRWLLWPVILVWKVWFSMLDRLSLILLVGSVGRFGLVVLDW